MKPIRTLIMLWIACCWTVELGAQLVTVTNAGPQIIFPGPARNIAVVFHNPASHSFASDLRTRTYQASSATVVLLSEKSWKNLQVLPGQTVIESTTLDFPMVKAETKFIVQWLEGNNRSVGQAEVMVYPTNLLEELRPLAGDGPIGIFDPQNQIKPLLQELKLDFTDLEISDVESYQGKLAIFGPFQSKAQMRDGLGDQIHALSKKDVAIVWIQPPPEKGAKLQPSFYPVLDHTSAVVLVQSELAANLADNPRAQLTLIYFCRLARAPHSFSPFDPSWNP